MIASEEWKLSFETWLPQVLRRCRNDPEQSDQGQRFLGLLVGIADLLYQHHKPMPEKIEPFLNKLD